MEQEIEDAVLLGAHEPTEKQLEAITSTDSPRVQVTYVLTAEGGLGVSIDFTPEVAVDNRIEHFHQSIMEMVNVGLAYIGCEPPGTKKEDYLEDAEEWLPEDEDDTRG